MSYGWIKIHRKIQDCDIWDFEEPFDRRSAWIDLLLLANYEDKKTVLNGKVVLCKRGDVNLSISSLAERWKWDRKKVRKFIRTAEELEMVTTNITTHRTTITIVNYDKFQDCGTTDCTTDGIKDGQPNCQKLPTTKNIKKIRNNVNSIQLNNNSRFAPPTIEQVEAYVQEKGYKFVDATVFCSYYGSVDWHVGKKKMTDWHKAIAGWEAREKKRQKPKPNSFNKMEKSDYDMDEIEKLMGG